MNSACKIIAYITISSLLSWAGYKEEGGFLYQLSIFIIPLLATLLAINITTMALVSGEMRKIIERYDNNGDIFNKTMKAIKSVFIIQITLFVLLFSILIVREIPILCAPEYIYWNKIGSNAIMIGILGYYLEIIMDSGKSLLEILNYR